MAWNQSAFQQSLDKYLTQLQAQTGYDVTGGGGGGGSSGGGGAGSPIAALAASIAAKYGMDAAKTFLAEKYGIKTAGDVLSKIGAELGLIDKAADATTVATKGFDIAGSIDGVGSAASGAGAGALASGVANQTVTPLGTGAFDGITGSMSAGTSAAPAAGLSTATTLGGALAGIAGTYQAAQLAKRLSDESRQGSKLRPALEGGLAGAGIGLGAATLGAQLGTAFMPGVGTAIGAGLGILGGLAGKMTASGKSKNQMSRDLVRKYLTQSGLLDDKYEVPLATGGTFNFGMDGGARLKNADGTERRYNEVDLSNKTVDMSEATSLLMPLGYIAAMQGGNAGKEQADAMSAYFINAATQGAKSDADVFKNAQDLAKRMGVNTSNYSEYIDALKENGYIANDQDYNILKTKASWLATDEQPGNVRPRSTSDALNAYLAQMEAKKNAQPK